MEVSSALHVKIREVEGGERHEGGAWARLKEEDSGQVFLLSHKYISKCLCARWIGSQALPFALAFINS